MSHRRAKAIRKMLNADLAQFGLTVRAAVHVTSAVPSRRYNVTTEDGKVLEGSAPQVRLHPECPRAVYQRVKANVQATRRA